MSKNTSAQRPPNSGDIVVPLKERRSLQTLKSSECRWPYGDPRGKDFTFAGSLGWVSGRIVNSMCAVASIQHPAPIDQTFHRTARLTKDALYGHTLSSRRAYCRCRRARLGVRFQRPESPRGVLHFRTRLDQIASEFAKDVSDEPFIDRQPSYVRAGCNCQAPTWTLRRNERGNGGSSQPVLAHLSIGQHVEKHVPNTGIMQDCRIAPDAA
jgi:GcrA cell cycle regulator